MPAGWSPQPISAFPAAPAVDLQGVCFGYGVSNGALYSDFSLSIAPGSILAIMGASGSGKTTLARIIAGILNPQQGNVLRSEELGRYDVVYLDQQPMNSVFPWQRVRANIRYPLQKLRWRSLEAEERLAYLLSLFRLQGTENAYPAQLSGGELQRVALARCLSWRPKLVVLDEPFSALDGKIKEEIAAALRQLAARDGITLVLVTHNITDALAMASRCVVIGHRPVRIIGDHQFAPAGEVPAPDQDTMQQALINSIRDGLV